MKNIIIEEIIQKKNRFNTKLEKIKANKANKTILYSKNRYFIKIIS